MAVSTQSQTSYSRSHTGLTHKSGESFRPCVEISCFDRREAHCATSRRVPAYSLHQRLAQPAQMPKRKGEARGTEASRRVGCWRVRLVGFGAEILRRFLRPGNKRRSQPVGKASAGGDVRDARQEAEWRPLRAWPPGPKSPPD